MQQRWTAGLAHLMTLEEPVFGPCRNSSCTFVPLFLGWTYGSVKTMAISAVNISLSFTTLNSVDLSCLENLSVWDFPGSPVVKTLPRHARVAGSSLVEELRSHMPCGQKKKKKEKAKIIHLKFLWSFPKKSGVQEMCCSGPCWSNPQRGRFQYSHHIHVLSGFLQGSHVIIDALQAQEFLLLLLSCFSRVQLCATP